MTAEAAVAEIGHNLPEDPLEAIREQLADHYARTMTKAEDLLQGVQKCPIEIEDVETARQVTDFVNQVKAIAVRLEEGRKEEGEPYTARTAVVNDFFKPTHDLLRECAGDLEDRLTAFQTANNIDQVRGDYGGVASVTATTAFEIESLEDIPLTDLRQFIPESAIEKAIRAAIKDGRTEIEGVRIFEKKTTVVR